jgi:hypothetical protein
MANEEKIDILLSADIEDKATSKIAELYKETAWLKHEQKGLDVLFLEYTFVFRYKGLSHKTLSSN